MSTTSKKSKKSKKNPRVAKSDTKIEQETKKATGNAKSNREKKASPNSAEGSSGGVSEMSVLFNSLLNDTPPPTKDPTPVKIEIPSWAKPPWPEWSDSIINREIWEENVSSVRELFLYE